MATNGNGQLQGEGKAGVGTENINTDIVTLTRFLTEEQAKHKEATGDFTWVAPAHGRLNCIRSTC
jgi:fructose-1,6-bisphosphatase I